MQLSFKAYFQQIITYLLKKKTKHIDFNTCKNDLLRGRNIVDQDQLFS